MTNNEKACGIFFSCRDWKFHKFTMGDFPQGACWRHVPPQMLRGAAAGFNKALAALGLPYQLEVDHGPESGKQIRKLFLICGDGAVITVKVQIADTVVILNRRAVSVKGSAAAGNLVEALIDVLEETLLPPPPKRPVGRPPKLPLNMLARSWPPAPRPNKVKRKPLARKPILPQHPPLKKDNHRA